MVEVGCRRVWGIHSMRKLGVVALGAALGGCASSAADITPAYVSPVASRSVKSAESWAHARLQPPAAEDHLRRDALFGRSRPPDLLLGLQVQPLNKEILMRILALAIFAIGTSSVGPAAAQTYDPAYPV